MGLVFEVDQPLLRLSVHLNGNDDGAGVDLIRLLLVGQKPLFLEDFGPGQSNVHQTDEFIISVLIENPVVILILVEGLSDGLRIEAIGNLYMRQLRGEGGVAAVVGPVGVQDTDLGHGGIPLLLLGEVGLNPEKVLEGHGQIQ